MEATARDDLHAKDQFTTHPSSPDRLVGRAVSHYHVLQRLGAGGMGVVYKARDLQLDRHVALKFLRPHLHADEDARERFLREARAASALQDPHICTIYEIGETEDGQLFISMAFYEGETLESKIKGGPLPAAEVIRYTTEIAAGLAHAHSAGIVHRDVKPSNVLVTEKGRIRLLDFGIAKIRDVAMTLPGATLGTAAYMSPEQARGEAVDHRTDIWSLGVVLFEMVTGRRPFPGDYEQAVLYAILNEEPWKFHPVADNLPVGLEDIIDTCLMKHPDYRYPHVQDLQIALARLSASSPEELSANANTGAHLLARDRLESSELPPRPADSRGSEMPKTQLHRQRRAGSPREAGRLLPTLPTPFVGREHEVDGVLRLLRSDAVRLVTLAGPGGSGKTRLALKVAACLEGEFENGVHFVPLAAVTDPDLVASSISMVVGAKESPVRPVIEILHDHLRDRRALLVLDNFEQVAAAAAMIADLMTRCMHVKVLVTSRVVLHLSGEHEYQLPPLNLPDLKNLPAAEDLSNYSAIALFVQRARAVMQDFAISKENARDIVEICDRVDGLPLAIELAAAHIKLFSARALRARLDQRLHLLKGGARDLPARHKALRSTIDWSYDLLEPGEQALFRRLSVFMGGCTLEAAERVGNTPESIGFDVLDAVSALIDKSLLRREDGVDGEPRFTMLQTIREYGEEVLKSTLEEEAVRQAHAHCCVDLAEQARPHLTGTDQATWLARLEAEHDNLRAAFSWAEERHESELALRLGTALWRFWAVRGLLGEGHMRLKRILHLPGAHVRTAGRARALNALGTIVHEIGEFASARSYLDESLSIFREIGDRNGIATVLNDLGWVSIHEGDTSARTRLHEALALNRELKNARGAAVALHSLGWIELQCGNYGSSRAFLEESLIYRREAGDLSGAAYEIANLAFVDQCQGRFAEAAGRLDDAFRILNEVGHRQLIAWTLYVRGHGAYEQGRYEEAESFLLESASSWRDVDNRLALAWTLVLLANVARDLADRTRATELLEECLSLWKETGALWGIPATLCALGRVAAANEDYEKALTLYSESVELCRSLDGKLVLVDSLEAMAAAHLSRDDIRSAAAPFAEADALRAMIQAPPPPRIRIERERITNALRTELGEETFAAILATAREQIQV
jgi:non-specific serine/threonine protein kinase